MDRGISVAPFVRRPGRPDFRLRFWNISAFGCIFRLHFLSLSGISQPLVRIGPEAEGSLKCQISVRLQSYPHMASGGLGLLGGIDGDDRLDHNFQEVKV